MKLTSEQERKLLIISLAEYLQTSLTDKQVVMYAVDLEDVPNPDLASAIDKMRKDPGLKRGEFPLPAQIRRYIERQEDIPEIIAGRVLEAVARFGYYQPSAARQWLGEAGWEVAMIYGYTNLCALPTEQVGFCHTHLTKIARGVLDARRRGMDSTRSIEGQARKAITNQEATATPATEATGLRASIAEVVGSLRGDGRQDKRTTRNAKSDRRDP